MTLNSELKGEIARSQGGILESLAEIEDLAAAVYQVFGQQLPTEKGFWDGLAREEQGHGRLLRGLKRILERGHLFQDIGRFSPAELNKAKNVLREAMDTADGQGVGRRDALNAALAIEACFIEAGFFRTVSSDAPEFGLVCTQLLAHSRTHLQRICDYAADIIAKDIDFKQQVASLTRRLEHKDKDGPWGRFRLH